MRSLWARFVPGPAILLYHRVATLDIDPWGLAVAPEHFDAQLDVLRRRAAVVPLDDLLAGLNDGRLPRRSVAVTFDDGYADNLLAAKPVLERHGVPATVFVTTGQLGRHREFWWDELEAILLTPGSLPKEMALDIEGQRHRWLLNGSADYTERDARQHRRWRPWKEPPTPRHAAFAYIWRRLQHLDDGGRSTILQALAAWAGRHSSVRPSHRTLDAGGVRELARGGAVSIGAHSVTHPRLSTLPEHAQLEELATSRAHLERILGRPVTALAYPFGGASDYTAATQGLAREAGFSCACTGRVGTVRRSTDPFALPRCHVPNVNGSDFEQLLERWLHLA